MKRYSLIAFLSGLCMVPLEADRQVEGAEKPAQPWGGAALSDWANASKELVLSEIMLMVDLNSSKVILQK